MIENKIDDRSEFLEWAEQRSKTIANHFFDSESQSEIHRANSRQITLRLEIREALLEVFDRMVAGE